VIVRGVKTHDVIHVILICVVMMGSLVLVSGAGFAVSDTEDEMVSTVAVVTIIEGEVELFRPSVVDAMEISEGMDILVGDELITAKDGNMELELKDGSVLKIGPSSYITIIEVNVVEVTGLSHTVIELVSGKIRALVASLVFEESSYTIKSKNVTVGVRGTDFGVFI